MTRRALNSAICTTLVALLVAALAGCGDPMPTASPQASVTATVAATATPRLDERLDAAAATATARAGEPRFNGEILGLYVAPTIGDWPSELREEHEQTVAAGCTSAPTGQGELDFVGPLVLPAGFERVGDQPHVTPASDPEVVACGSRTTALTLEFTKPHQAGPAMIAVVRTTARAFDFDAAASDVRARTIGGRQAVMIRPTVAGAPGQRAMVLFPEDFGATAIHAFNVAEPDLLAFATAVAGASATHWEREQDGVRGRTIRVCAEIPAGATNDHAAFGFTEDAYTTRASWGFFDAAANKSVGLVLYAGDALDGCPDHVRAAMEWAHDPAIYEAAGAWVETNGGELTAECANRPIVRGRDDARIDWCFYRPYRETGGDVVLTISRGVDFTLPLVLRARDGGYDVVSAVQRESDELRMWYFHDDDTMRWTRYPGAAAYRLTATLVAGREHAPDACAEPPLEEDTRTIVLDETLAAEADGYALALPGLPPQDAWWVSIAGTGTDAMIHLYALDAEGGVIAETGATWVRDIFCVRPRRDAS